MSRLELLFNSVAGLVLVPEFRFAPPRRWRFDYALPEQRIAIEVDGAAFTRGRHTRGVGFLNDLEKFNAAAILGWSVLRYPPDRVHVALDDVLALLNQRKAAA
jgi:very-short-patch-repair endonuclease